MLWGSIIGNLLCLDHPRAPVLGDHPREPLGTGENLHREELSLGFQQPRLGRRDALGEGIRDEFLDEFRELAVALELAGGRCAERQASRGLLEGEFLQDPQRVPEEGRSFGVALERAIGREQGETVGDREPALEDGAPEPDLLLFPKPGQAVGEAQGEPSFIDPRVKAPREPSLEGITLRDPGALSAQELGHRRVGQAVVLDERGDHPGLVHGRSGPPGSVGTKQERLGLVAAGLLDEDGELLEAGIPGRPQALEAVDDLEATGLLLGRDDADRQLGESIGARRDL